MTMSYKLRLEGFPSITVSDTIDLPFRIDEVLRTPWGTRISADDAYKHGGEIMRYLLDHTPLHNTKKYVNIYLGVHYVTPQLLSVPTSDWHCDGSGAPFLADDILHTMICDTVGLGTNLRTEFLAEHLDLDVADYHHIDQMNHQEFRQWIATYIGDDVTPEEVEPSKMYTWTSRHLHRVGFAKEPHFRMFWKVAESDLLVPNPTDKAFKSYTMATLGNNGTDAYSIEQGPKGIICRGMHI
jgi:hypothetical protein